MYMNNYFSVANYDKTNINVGFTTIKNKDNNHDIVLSFIEPYNQTINIVVNHKQAFNLLTDLIRLLTYSNEEINDDSAAVSLVQ